MRMSRTTMLISAWGIRPTVLDLTPDLARRRPEIQLRIGLARLTVLGVATLGMSGCGSAALIGGGAVAGLSVASVATIGRSPIDAVYSLATGRDCSIVRLDQEKSYCRPVDPPPDPMPFCTRSLGGVNCWADPANLSGHPVSVGEAPAMTAEQEAYRVRRWPWW